MFEAYDVSALQRLVDDQASLARIAVSPDVREMHLELAALYRSQLACAVAANRLNFSDLRLAA